jgi:hypothetical protein
MKISTTIVLILLVATFSQAQSRKAVQLRKDYLEVAHLKVVETKTPLSKWEGIDTISYHIEGKLQYMTEKSLKMFLQEIQELTGLTFVESKDKGKYQILFFFGTLAGYSTFTKNDIPLHLVEKSRTWHSFLTGPNNRLLKTSFCINPSLVKSQLEGRFYFQSLFLKCIGIRGNTDDDLSIFCKYYSNKNSGLTMGDKRLVKLHYNPKIKSGMLDYLVEQTLNDSIDLEMFANEKL